MSPEQRERTLRAAEKFRTAAADMPADPPEDIDQLIWDAMRESYLGYARELEEAVQYPVTNKGDEA